MILIAIFLIFIIPTLAISNNLLRQETLKIEGLILSFFYYILLLAIISLAIPKNFLDTNTIGAIILIVSSLSQKKYFNKKRKMGFVCILYCDFCLCNFWCR